MDRNSDYYSKENFEYGDIKHNNYNSKNKIMKKYLNTVEAGMKEETNSFSGSSKLNSNTSNEEFEERSCLGSEENIILTGKEGRNCYNEDEEGNEKEVKSEEGNEKEVKGEEGNEKEVKGEEGNEKEVIGEEGYNSYETQSLNESSIHNSLSYKNTYIISNKDNNSNSESLNDELDDLPPEEDEKQGNSTSPFEEENEQSNGEKKEKDKSERHVEEQEGAGEYGTEECKDSGKKTNLKKYSGVNMPNLLKSDALDDYATFEMKECLFNLGQMQMDVKNSAFFDVEIKDINEWKAKYRYLTSSYRKLDKEINKTINSEQINLITRRSIKQHKDFLDDEYKEWLGVLQKTVSEFRKNIGSHVSELNEREYLILSRNICEDFKEKNIEEGNINVLLYLLVMKHEISIEHNVMKYLEDSYMSISTDKILNNTVQKIIEVNKNIKDIGGKTGTWSDEENNYFMKVYESNSNFGDKVLVDVLKSGISKSEEEIYEHLAWYRQFVSYKNLKNKYTNSISIININDQKKNDSKVEEKKYMIQKWKEKKKQESDIKNMELQQMKKDEMKIKKKMREDIKKKKQMIQEQLNSKKKEEMKKNKIEKSQKSILSEEMLQRINERNERILQKKVQSNLNINEENNEKDKKIHKQKYMHIQSKLLSNTDNLLKRIESTVETIKNIL
ncbi:conserved Plasmodium protein, unknown function [Plasmodium malariae]|uniref:Uncharacterized protein n=1 Tax=Plasmodium malariae TaxID=5858 RepID=A0A1C3KYH3_PLAMA|nr:conserved Plasmodium protein, unknown function [Plasmodium malariae]